MSINWQLVTDAASEPITQAQAKTHMRITAATDNDYVDILIKTARCAVERLTGRAILTQTWNLFLDDFPANSSEVIHVPWSPLLAVTHIKYYDTDNTQQTWDSDYYQVDITSEPGRIIPVSGQSYPSVYSGRLSAVEIQYTAGYGATIAAATLLPPELSQAMYMLMAHWYENRENVLVGTIAKEIEFAVTALTDLVSVGWVF